MLEQKKKKKKATKESSHFQCRLQTANPTNNSGSQQNSLTLGFNHNNFSQLRNC